MVQLGDLLKLAERWLKHETVSCRAGLPVAKSRVVLTPPASPFPSDVRVTALFRGGASLEQGTRWQRATWQLTRNFQGICKLLFPWEKSRSVSR